MDMRRLWLGPLRALRFFGDLWSFWLIVYAFLLILSDKIAFSNQLRTISGQRFSRFGGGDLLRGTYKGNIGTRFTRPSTLCPAVVLNKDSNYESTTSRIWGSTRLHTAVESHSQKQRYIFNSSRQPGKRSFISYKEKGKGKNVNNLLKKNCRVCKVMAFADPGLFPWQQEDTQEKFGFFHKYLKRLRHIFTKDDDDINSFENNAFEGWFKRMWREYILTLHPVTRTYICATAFFSCILTFLSAIGESLPASYFSLNFDKIIRRGQIHRIFTPFFYVGELSLPMFMSISFIYSYLNQLEDYYVNIKQKRIFYNLISFGTFASLSLAYFNILPPDQVLQCVLSYLLYIQSRIDPTQEIDFHGLFKITNASLPLILSAQNFILEGKILRADPLGILIALVSMKLLDIHKE